VPVKAVKTRIASSKDPLIPRAVMEEFRARYTQEEKDAWTFAETMRQCIRFVFEWARGREWPEGRPYFGLDVDPLLYHAESLEIESGWDAARPVYAEALARAGVEHLLGGMNSSAESLPLQSAGGSTDRYSEGGEPE